MARSRSPSSRHGRGSTPPSRGRHHTPTPRGRGRRPTSRGRIRSQTPRGRSRSRPSRSRVNSPRRSFSRSTSRARSARHSHDSPLPRPTYGPVLPPSGAGVDPAQIFGEMKDVVLKHFEEVHQTLAAQKEEMEEKFKKSSVPFTQKPIEKQFEVNSRILALNHKIQKALKNKDYKRVKKLVREQEEELNEHEENLLIAEHSQYGWLTVSKIRCKKLDPSIMKKIEQVDALIDMAKK